MSKDKGILFKDEMVQAILNTQWINGRAQPINPTRPYKDMTRRVIKFRDSRPVWDSPHTWDGSVAHEDAGGNWIFWSGGNPLPTAEDTKRLYPHGEGVPCPYGRAGDALWVREAFHSVAPAHLIDEVVKYQKVREAYVTYRADTDAYPVDGGWTPSLFMPRWASRLTLTIVSVRPERLQDISYQDMIAEGVSQLSIADSCGGSEPFAYLWNSINANPKPVKVNGRADDHYVSYPWGAGFHQETYRGRPHYIFGNPYVWRIQFAKA